MAAIPENVPPNEENDNEGEEQFDEQQVDDDEEEDDEQREQRLKEEAYVRALARCGIRGEHLLAYLYTSQGQTTIDDLAALNDTEINTMVTTVSKTLNPGPVPRGRVRTFLVINAVAQKRLKGYANGSNGTKLCRCHITLMTLRTNG